MNKQEMWEGLNTDDQQAVWTLTELGYAEGVAIRMVWEAAIDEREATNA